MDQMFNPSDRQECGAVINDKSVEDAVHGLAYRAERFIRMRTIHAKKRVIHHVRGAITVIDPFYPSCQSEPSFTSVWPGTLFCRISPPSLLHSGEVKS